MSLYRDLLVKQDEIKAELGKISEKVKAMDVQIQNFKTSTDDAKQVTSEKEGGRK